jgi:hypothetical protein
MEGSSEPGYAAKYGVTTVSWVISPVLFLIGGLILGDVISVDQSAKGGAVAGLFIGGTLLLILGITSRGVVSTGETLGSRFSSFFPPITGSITNGFRILYYFLPYILFALGFFIDIIAAKVQYIPAGITAFITCLINYLSSRTWYGITVDRDMCGIPGLSSMSSQLLPQSALFNLTVLSHMAMYITLKQGFFGINKIAPIWGLFGAVGILQGIVLFSTGCFESVPIGFLKIAMSAGVAALAGYIGAYVTTKYVTDDVASGSSGRPLLGPGGIQRCPDGSTPGPTGKCPGPSAETCSAVGDDQFVCEAYKNGQLVTSTIVG